MPTLYQAFRLRWESGCGSALCPEATHVCLARGTVPCDILFVAEAPSVGADVVGQPCIGEFRLILDKIIERASVPKDIPLAFTNLVGCIPRDPENSARATRPPDEAILACQPRLLEFIELCHPKLIVAVGSLAWTWLPITFEKRKPRSPVPIVRIMHPAHLQRKLPYIGYDIQRAADTLANAVAEHVKRDHKGDD